MATYEPGPRWPGLTPAARRQALLIALALLGLVVFYLWGRLTSDVPVRYHSGVDHFKYGSTGGERSSGIPLALWKVMPKVCPEHLPGQRYVKDREYESFGFIYEDGKDLPVGVSRRNVMGLSRVFLNCAICHAGTVRFAKDAPRQLVPGMPSNTVDLEAFQRFISNCAADENFDVDRLMAEIRTVDRQDAINAAAIRYVGVPMMRQRLLMLRHRFRYLDWEPDFGPGRVDTWPPAKVLLNFPLEKIPAAEIAGTVDFPSIWLQRKRKGMHLHWDGNNESVEERNRSAAFGTGAFPPTLDRASMRRIEEWLWDAEPPRFPAERIDQAKAAEGRPLYERYCADCHGRDGRDFSGKWVGQVDPIERIATDRRHLDSYSQELATAQNTLYAGYPDDRFSHFRKTFGYANLPLDGVWLRAPYLHNGSVPTLRDLLEPGERRPTAFYRGYDLYDPLKMGFVSEPQHFSPDGRSLLNPEDPRRYFRFAVLCADDPRQCDAFALKCREGDQASVCGNGNRGHEGEAYGTLLAPAQKDALVEYLKTF
jgi:processive rubber oxygenase RoxA-like protein